jgi:PAS domain S-box-containing protein
MTSKGRAEQSFDIFARDAQSLRSLTVGTARARRAVTIVRLARLLLLRTPHNELPPEVPTMSLPPRSTPTAPHSIAPGGSQRGQPLNDRRRGRAANHMNLSGPAGAARAARAEAIAHCAAAVARAETLDEVVSVVVDQSMALGASAAALFITLEDDPGALRLVAHRNLTAALVEGVAHVTLNTPHLASRAASTRDLQVIEDLEQIDPALSAAADLLVRTRSRSMICAPLVTFGRLYGVLTWTHADPYSPTAAERAAIRAMAEVFAIGIAKTEARDAKASAEIDAPYAQLVRAVAQRHHLEALLRDRETRLRAIFDHSTEFIGLLSMDGILLEANQAPLDFAGVERAAVIGRPFWEGPWWSESAQIQEQLRGAIDRAVRGEFVRYEVRHVRAVGAAITVDFSLSPVMDETGSVVLIVAEGRDITERKETERQREEWISIIAHDLRQPANAILLRANFLERTALGKDPELHKELGHIGASVRILARMISDLLDASRLEVGRMTLNRRPVQVDSMVRDIVARNVEAGCEVHFDVRGPFPALNVDAERLEQAFTNLLSNAVKYGRAGAPIEVVIARTSDELTLSVGNWGDGIDAKEIPDLFRRFYRTARARTGKVAGIGVGLYIARGLVEAHGGRLWVESDPGAKTTFHIHLPIP